MGTGVVTPAVAGESARRGLSEPRSHREREREREWSLQKAEIGVERKM